MGHRDLVACKVTGFPTSKWFFRKYYDALKILRLSLFRSSNIGAKSLFAEHFDVADFKFYHHLFVSEITKKVQGQ